jgi:hypothetical protein
MLAIGKFFVRIEAAMHRTNRLRMHVASLRADEHPFLEANLKYTLQGEKEWRAIVTMKACPAFRQELRRRCSLPLRRSRW